jgi:hypothetical protein
MSTIFLLPRLVRVPSLFMATVVVAILVVPSFCCAESVLKRIHVAQNLKSYQMMEPQFQTITDDFIKFDDVAHNQSSTWVCAATTLCYESTYGPTVRPNGCCGALCCYGRDKCCSSLGHCVHCSSSHRPASAVIVGGVAAGIIGCIVLAMCVGVARQVTRRAMGNNANQAPVATTAEPSTPVPSYTIAQATIQYALTASGEEEGDIELEMTPTGGDEPYRYGTIVSMDTSAATLTTHHPSNISSSVAASADASDLASACTVSSHHGASNHGDDTNAVPRAFAVPVISG